MSESLEQRNQILKSLLDLHKSINDGWEQSYLKLEERNNQANNIIQQCHALISTKYPTHSLVKKMETYLTGGQL